MRRFGRSSDPPPDELARAARELRARVPPPPPGLDARILTAVERPASPPRGRPWPRRPLAAALAGAAALAVVALLAAGGHPGTRPDAAHAVPILPLTADCPAAGDDPRRLVVAGVWDGEEARAFARVLRDFERRTGVATTFAYETRDIAAKLEARLKRGCAPDVAILPQPGLLHDLAVRGQIRPLNPAARRASVAHYSSEWRQLATVGGRLYGVWFKAADKSTFWYRPDVLRAAGVSAPPRTWSELLDTLHALARHGVRPLSVAGAAPWTLTDWFENLYLRSAGPVPYQRLAEHRLSWTDPSVLRVLRQLGELFADQRLVGPTSEAVETSFEESVGDVFGGHPGPPRAAMVFEGDFVRSFLPGGAPARFFDFPAVDGGTTGALVVGGDVAVTFSGTPAAQRLLRYLASPRAAMPWARAGGFLSPNRSVPPRAYPDALARSAAAALARARTVRFDLSDLQPPAFGATAEQGMWGIFQDFLADPSDPEGTARRLERAARAAWACERAIEGRC